MSKRNAAWLAIIVLVGALVGVAVGPWWGLLAAAVVLVISELVERVVRVRRRRARTGAIPREDT